MQISRTRFIGNFAPLTSTRMSTMRLTDVEFRDNIVNFDNKTKPAAILAVMKGYGASAARCSSAIAVAVAKAQRYA